ncbi:hypothetical protein HF325_002543 [Metschnikowia pulcherrima]|uniref:Pre-mRNA-splicing factor SPF27 n=1 Tax=Metschnikowia pulcherrima TaxID=27326 RepID=A0A8H7LCY7_9ASCO|nr:hypothetical protein HF325_002543 [Metschnikowia pulcherrima]
MLSFETDPVDYLPFIDGEITDAERQAVEQLIRAEMPAETGPLHPMVGTIMPLSENRSLLMRDMAQFESEDVGGVVPDTFLLGGITMDRYTDFGPDDNVDYARMYTSLLYSILRERNAQMGVENANERAQAQKAAHERLAELEKAQKSVLVRKRANVEELKSARQAKQAQFQPVNGYLEQRWKDGIKHMVDLGIDKQLLLLG